MDGTSLQTIAETSLTWVGFGVVSGMLAKAILPGRDPGGTAVTAILGLGGALLGAGVYAWAGGERISDLITPLGFAIAVGGALVLLLSHRLFSGRILHLTDVGEGIINPNPSATRYRRRRRTRVYDDD